MKSVRHVVPSAALAAFASVTTACGGAATSETVAAQVAADELDVHRPGDISFFKRLQMPGALLARPPQDLMAGTKAATAVIIAEVTDVRPTRVVGPPGSDLPLIGVVLRPLETLHGRLQPELKDVIVEYPAPPAVDSPDPASALRASMPQGKSVWFLRWNGAPQPGVKPKPGARPIPQEAKAFYSTVSLDGGMFTQGSRSVVCPTAEESGHQEGVPTMRTHGERIKKLSELAQKIREVN